MSTTDFTSISPITLPIFTRCDLMQKKVVLHSITSSKEVVKEISPINALQIFEERLAEI